MLLQIFVLALFVLGTKSQNCLLADLYECECSACANYNYVNSSCVLNTSLNCQSGQIYYDNTCTTCSNLTSVTCSSICPDYLWVQPLGSGPSECVCCQTLYGNGCLRCNSEYCLVCAYSTNLTLSADGKSCVNNNCSMSNCLVCYQAGTKCYQCKTGYVTNSNYTCVSAPCTISNCLTCNSNICSICASSYTLSTDNTTCNPVCNDINCLTCIGPGVCSQCITAYIPINGVCTIDCSHISVANCYQCNNYYTCTACNAGYTLLESGTYCQPVCQVANCLNCKSAPNVCTNCNQGYDLSTNGTLCSPSFCYINYCATCLTLSSCSVCIEGFSLNSGNTTCTSNCPTQSPTAFPNCLFCTSTACSTCVNGYYVNSSSQCQLICSSIANCVTCYSSTICASCAANYILSAGGTTCSQVCKVTGCSVCANATVNNCQTCKSGYTAVTANNVTKCTINCGQGKCNTGVGGVVNCQSCSQAISYCNQCTYNSPTITCTSCVDGYFLNGNSCDKCSNAISNCISCSSSITCTACYQGFKPVLGQCVSGACSSSVTNCFCCSSSNACNTCNPGYFLNASNLCQLKACPNTYVFDYTTASCVCPISTFESDGVCYSCGDPNCYNCTINVCSKCSIGYYPNGLTCQPCINNCAVCSSATSCSQCANTYSQDQNGNCVQFGKGDSCAVSLAGIVYQCEAGCDVCIIGSTNEQIVICIQVSNGYSLVGGALVKCDPSCLTCASYLSSICTSCYPRYTLISGSCTPCEDPNALTCSPYSPSYSLTCVLGYTATYFSNSGSIGGLCIACAEYCNSCDSTGPGNCDVGDCISGTVQLVGTTNCTYCFYGCSQCSPTNLNVCLNCGPRRYINSNSTCSTCQIGCITCVNNASNCQNCDTGYGLVGNSCVLIPAKCTGLNSNGVCKGCYAAYNLNPVTNACLADLSCNITNPASCVICPDGFYLIGTECFFCSLSNNCVSCNVSNKTQCIGCSPGYYLDINRNCDPCPSNCLTCDSQVFCTKAAPGYYTILLSNGAYSGAYSQCLNPCATCVDYPDFCLTCTNGYALDGTVCRLDIFIVINIVFGQSASGNSIFLDSDDSNTQQFYGIKACNRLGAAIDSILPLGFKDSRPWFKRLRFRTMTKGSIQTTMSVENVGYSNGNSATSDLTNALATSSIDGVRYISSSAVPYGNWGSNAAGANLGLILGLTIPLSILLILIIILIAYYRHKRNKANEEMNENPIQSNQHMEKKEVDMEH